MTGAGLLRRYAAWSLDALVVAVPTLLLCRGRIEAGATRMAEQYDSIARTMAEAVLGLIDGGGTPDQLFGVLMQDGAMHGAVAGLTAAVLATLWPPLLVFALVSWLYFTAFEASSWQATPGKRLLGLRVCAADGGRAGVWMAGLRQAAGVLSWLSLNLGHAWAAKPPERRALHDHIAGARVVQADAAGSIPPWARLWLLLQIAAGFAALVWLYRVANAASVRAFDALL